MSEAAFEGEESAGSEFPWVAIGLGAVLALAMLLARERTGK